MYKVPDAEVVEVAAEPVVDDVPLVEVSVALPVEVAAEDDVELEVVDCFALVEVVPAVVVDDAPPWAVVEVVAVAVVVVPCSVVADEPDDGGVNEPGQ